MKTKQNKTFTIFAHPDSIYGDRPDVHEDIVKRLIDEGKVLEILNKYGTPVYVFNKAYPHGSC